MGCLRLAAQRRDLMDVKDATARILGRKADIMTRRSLHPVLRKKIEASAHQVF
jgi:predicted nucleotidyltransferase